MPYAVTMHHTTDDPMQRRATTEGNYPTFNEVKIAAEALQKEYPGNKVQIIDTMTGQEVDPKNPSGLSVEHEVTHTTDADEEDAE